MNKKIFRVMICALVLMVSLTFFPILAHATINGEQQPLAAAETTGMEEGAQPDANALKPIGAGVAIGLAAAGGAIGMGVSVAKSMESIARQPEAEDKIRGSLLLGLVFVETAIIYALVIAILIIFVL